MQAIGKPAPRLVMLLNLAAFIYPVLGVILLGWNAFDMVFIYLAESAIVSWFGVKKQALVWKQRSAAGKASTPKPGSTAWVFLLFGFFYVFIRMMGSMTHAFDYSANHIVLRDMPLLVAFLDFMLAPLLHNPGMLPAMGISFLTSLADHISYIRSLKYSSVQNTQPDRVFALAVLHIFVLVVISFTIFWFVTLAGHLFGVNTDRFVHITLAVVLLAVQHAQEMIRMMTRKIPDRATGESLPLPHERNDP